MFGLIGVPLLTWMVGDRILGPYSHGSNPHAGPLALLGDFFAGLGHGALVYWVVALGPALFLLLLQLLALAFQRSAGASGAD
ncbi:MAG TPA: hypothetical protein VJQ47_12940 [Steroidobacteraceae bacterium]|nr:hypothetical protein [Steroidobacteraceae bacterium]